MSVPIGIYERVALNAFPSGAHLKCANPTCDRGERIDPDTIAGYLARGWPMHCGLTMELVKD